MAGAYLIALLVSLSGLLCIDYHLELAFFKHPRQTATIMLISITLFIIWDIAGIAWHIFFIGNNNYLIGLRIGQFPVEELFFLLLLNYTSLITYLIIKQKRGGA